jgi:crossover junction endodeoxyribonuclease RuvC
MIILGIDPGTATTGCGLIKVDRKKGAAPCLIKYEKVVTAAGDEMCDRLKKLHDDLSRIVKEHKPNALSVERLFFNTNIKTAMTVGQARGVIMLVAAEQRVPFFEYTALQAKKVLTDNGRADKKQMRRAVQEFLKLAEEVKSDDCADALAMAICHWHKVIK